MKAATKHVGNRRPKMEPPTILLDKARARVLKFQTSSLAELKVKLKGVLDDDTSGVATWKTRA